MKLREQEVRALATAILARLEKSQVMRIPGGQRADLEERIAKAIRGNLRAEEEIEAEAERFATSHSREMVGMDRHRVLQLVKERIAKEKGFTL
jgi:hypothetical protein